MPLFAACKLKAPSKPEPTPLSPEAIFTAAAQTADARLKQRFIPTATAESSASNETVIPASATATAILTATPIVVLDATQVLTSTNPLGQAFNQVDFVADVTIPDGTIIPANATFKKTWKIRNSGQSTWTTDYALVFIDGATMSTLSSISMPEVVAPGATVNISVDMTAPNEPGAYRGYWKLKAPGGATFGVPPNDGALWVDIYVEGDAPPVTATP